MLRQNINRAVFILFVFFAIILTLFSGRVSASDPASVQINSADANGQVTVEMRISPAVVKPGDSLSLELRVYNRGTRGIAPSVQLRVPAGLGIGMQQLPPSSSVNLPDNILNWNPLISAGDSSEFALPLRVDVADMANPEGAVSATFQVGSDVRSLSAAYWAGIVPVAMIDSAETASVGQPVELIADITGPGPFTQQWDLGDGRYFRAENPRIVYAAAGKYAVNLRVTNPLGTTTTTKEITVVPEPYARFTTGDAQAAAGAALQFVDESGGEPPLSYRWDFGDGNTSGDSAPEHTFAEPGTYEVRLLVQNEFGAAETVLPVTVGILPEVELLLDTNTTAVGEHFVAFAAGDSSITSYTWDMGDGRSYEGREVDHVYKFPGPRLVTLTATNSFGSVSTTAVIDVAEGILRMFLPMVVSDVAGDRIGQSTNADVQPAYLTDFTPIDLERSIVPADSSQPERLLWYINKARESVGLTPVQYVDSLSSAALRHTNDMAFNRFRAHTGSDGSRPSERQLAAGYEAAYAGEATAWGFEYASDAVAFWLSSPGHRPIILNPEATDVGVAFTYDITAPSIYYWTAEFGSTISDSPLPDYSQPVATAIPPTPTRELQVVPTVPVILPTETPLPVATTIPTQVPTAVATAEPTALPTLPAATATSAPTEEPTPEPTAEEVEPTPKPTKTPLATSEPTVEPTDEPVEPTATAIPATETPEPTNTPAPLPVASPTPTATPAATNTPIVEPTPLPTVEQSESAESQLPTDNTALPVDEVVPTATPSSTWNPGKAVTSFIESLWDSPNGRKALEFATDSLQDRIFDEGILQVLALDSAPNSYAIYKRTDTPDSSEVMVRFALADGSIHNRLMFVVRENDLWLVDTVGILSTE